MSIYLAARYSRRLELCGYRAKLQERGHAVLGRWLDGAHQLDNSGNPIGDRGEHLVEAGGYEAAALRLKFASEDLEDVLAADEIVAFTEEPRASTSRGGRHVEFGIAIGQGKDLTVVGPRENIFCWLPKVRHYETWVDFLAALERR